MLLRFSRLDDAYQWLTRLIIEEGCAVAPRGHGTREVIGVGFVLESPRDRLIGNVARNWSPRYAAAETLWHLSGSHNPRLLSAFSKFWLTWQECESSPCYGARIFGVEGRTLRWERLLEQIRRDPDTRQATLVIDPNEEDVRTCATSLSLYLRADQLHMTTYMRSNDVYLGFGYDVFFFTTLLEMASAMLGCDIGTYTHFVGSAHIYERDLARAEALIDSDPVGGLTPPIKHPVELMTTARQFAVYLEDAGNKTPSAAQDPFAEWCLDRVLERV